MATETKRRLGELDFTAGVAPVQSDDDAWNGPLLYPLYTGIACRVCHCPLLIDLGLENKSSKPKSVERRRHWYSCPLCGRGTIRPDITGKLVQVGEVDTFSFKLRKKGKIEAVFDF